MFLDKFITGNCKWRNIVKMTIDPQKLYNCGVHYPENLIHKTDNSFWKDTLQSFVDFRKAESFNIMYILQTPIFYNPDITIGNKSVFFKTWFENGVHFIGDLIKNHEGFELYGYEDMCNKYNFYPNHLHYRYCLCYN